MVFFDVDEEKPIQIWMTTPYLCLGAIEYSLQKGPDEARDIENAPADTYQPKVATDIIWKVSYAGYLFLYPVALVAAYSLVGLAAFCMLAFLRPVLQWVHRTRLTGEVKVTAGNFLSLIILASAAVSLIVDDLMLLQIAYTGWCIGMALLALFDPRNVTLFGQTDHQGANAFNGSPSGEHGWNLLLAFTLAVIAFSNEYARTNYAQEIWVWFFSFGFLITVGLCLFIGLPAILFKVFYLDRNAAKS